MIRKLATAIVTCALVTGVACSKRQLIEIPPRVDLYSLDVVGMVEFTSDAEGNLAPFATQRFIQTLQQAQPGVRVLELGNKSELLETFGHDRLDYAAIKEIGERFDVDAVIIGDLAVSEVRPNIDVSSILSSMSVSAEVDAQLTTRLLETARGATIWTKSTKCTRTVAHAGIGGGGSVHFDAEDPERSYGVLVDALVFDATRDFRVTYARQ